MTPKKKPATVRVPRKSADPEMAERHAQEVAALAAKHRNEKVELRQRHAEERSAPARQAALEKAQAALRAAEEKLAALRGDGSGPKADAAADESPEAAPVP